MNKTFLVATVKINTDEKEAMMIYLEGSERVLTTKGGKLISRYKVTETMLGENIPDLMAVFEFPNEESIVLAIESNEYKCLHTYRDRGFLEANIFITKER